MITMAVKKVGTVYADDGKKGGGVIVTILIGVAYLYFYSGFLDWWYEQSPPARYVEPSDR